MATVGRKKENTYKKLRLLIFKEIGEENLENSEKRLVARRVFSLERGLRRAGIQN